MQLSTLKRRKWIIRTQEAFASLRRELLCAHATACGEQIHHCIVFQVLSEGCRLIGKVNSSTKATGRLIISLAGMKLVRECPTRWSSTFLIIDRLLTLRPFLSQVLEELQWDHLAMSEWRTLDATRSLFQPSAHFTQLLSWEEFTTVSCVLPAFMDLNLHL